ncbi:MAG TPA: cytochrome c biogenesis protein [Terriglobales bacterium]|nr:cytochrome c biogenesis protein [Terriglobales bacterium]
MKRFFPILAILTAGLLSYGLYEALVVAPTDQMQGEVYRIIYYHVPSAWTAFLLFLINFVASIVYLIWRDMRADAVAVVTAEVGVVYCTIVLVTGPLWARPVWGIWWTWDIRLTSTLVLWLIYVSYLFLRRFSSSGQTPVLAAALAIFGALDVPLVYFSIWFFRTQHPQPVVGGGGSIDPRMWHVWLLNWAAFLCFAGLVCWSRYRLEILQREVEETQALEALLERSPR